MWLTGPRGVCIIRVGWDVHCRLVVVFALRPSVRPDAAETDSTREGQELWPGEERGEDRRPAEGKLNLVWGMWSIWKSFRVRMDNRNKLSSYSWQNLILWNATYTNWYFSWLRMINVTHSQAYVWIQVYILGPFTNVLNNHFTISTNVLPLVTTTPVINLHHPGRSSSWRMCSLALKCHCCFNYIWCKCQQAKLTHW